jgi:putative ABC transport system substrate-binding protein
LNLTRQLKGIVQESRFQGLGIRGVKPAELPVDQISKFEFLVNLKTAKALGLTVPDKLLALADEVIE